MAGVLAAPLRPTVQSFQTAVLQRHKRLASQRCRASLGGDAASGMLDLAKLVSSDGSGRKTPFDGLASKLGRELYADLNGWHLFLKDMRGTGELKMSQVLATAYGEVVKADGKVDEGQLTDLLKKMPVSIGAGKRTVSLHDFLPAACLADAVKIFEDFQRDL